MKVLIACEYSGRVRDAFLRAGHQAMSCDFLDTEVDGPHYKGDMFDIVSADWDLLIAHPPCTFLCSSGLHWNKNPKSSRFGGAETEQALSFVSRILALNIPRIALENPMGCIGTRLRPADQYVQPYEFGDDASKKTGLWLKGLPLLIADPAHRIAGRMVMQNGKSVERWSNQTDSGQNKLAPSEDRWKLRSETYIGIAAAMASQWG